MNLPPPLTKSTIKKVFLRSRRSVRYRQYNINTRSSQDARLRYPDSTADDVMPPPSAPVIAPLRRVDGVVPGAGCRRISARAQEGLAGGAVVVVEDGASQQELTRAAQVTRTSVTTPRLTAASFDSYRASRTPRTDAAPGRSLAGKSADFDVLSMKTLLLSVVTAGAPVLPLRLPRASTRP